MQMHKQGCSLSSTGTLDPDSNKSQSPSSSTGSVILTPDSSPMGLAATAPTSTSYRGLDQRAIAYEDHPAATAFE